MVLPYPTENNYLKTAEFGFGMIYENGTAYYSSILNSKVESGDPEGSYANTTILSTDLNGLGLPPQSYNKFVNYLSIVSSEVICDRSTSGSAGCLFSQTCDNYSDLWQYSFKVRFEYQSDSK